MNTLSVKEYADKNKISTKTVYRRIKAGIIKIANPKARKKYRTPFEIIV